MLRGGSPQEITASARLCGLLSTNALQNDGKAGFGNTSASNRLGSISGIGGPGRRLGRNSGNGGHSNTPDSGGGGVGVP